MCGIAGWLGTVVDGEVVATRMVRALRHRGPDGYGIRSWPDATLVHTRLSIIDLSPAGAQPMANEDGTVWTVFNGEIYNHHELRNKLESRGHIFRGRSDTEVLPHLYEEEGPDFISRLRGMFAIALYDARNRRLFLARDRFGIKPLFYAPGKERFGFSSEIRTFLELPGIDTRPDRQAIYDFAALLYIPAPETFYAGIRAIQPGEIVEASLDADGIEWKTRTYHRWSIIPDFTLTLDHAVDQADALLRTAVRRQVESDVPLGTLLSGGIDSSLVSASAQANLGNRLRTFNIRFPEKEYDETWAAVAVAKHISSHHQTLDMDEMQGSWKDITGLLLHAGQPFADTSLFPCNTICRLMRQQVTVALSGDGGDEGFGGYDFYWWITSIARWQALPPIIWRGASFASTPLARIGTVPTSLPQRLKELAEADDISIIQSLFCWTREREHASLCIDKDLLPITRFFEPQWEHHPPAGASRLEKLSMLATEANVRLVLANDFLFKVDTASMKESMEIRVPMLDEDLFDFGLSLPHRLKVNGRTCKKVLRKVAQQRLPAEVASKSKQGFSIPLDTWVDADFKARLKEALLGASSRLPEFFEPDVYKPIVESFCDQTPCAGISRQGLYQRVIMLLSVELAAGRGALEAEG